VAQQLLDRAYVLTALQQMRSEAVAQGVATRGFHDAGAPHGAAHSALHRFLVQMPANISPEFRYVYVSARGEDELPTRFVRCIPIFAMKGVREVDLSKAASAVTLVLVKPPIDMGDERWDDGLGENGNTVPVALAASDNDLPGSDVDVLDAKPKTFR
jgi:hypothetical protein